VPWFPRGSHGPLYDGWLVVSRPDDPPRGLHSATLHERVTQATHTLVSAGYNDAEAAIDAEVLARHVLGWTREQTLVRWREPAPADFEARYAPLVARRARHEPVAYIIGHREFWGLEIAVTRDTLIPRPETELIVEEALAIAPELGSAPTIVDVGTGSGCLAVALAHDLPAARVIAIDVSTSALDIAKRNAKTHGVADRITWFAGSLLEPVRHSVNLIVSNPPYVPMRDAATLQPDVRDYEPAVALFSGYDGLATIRALVHGRLADLRIWLWPGRGRRGARRSRHLAPRAPAQRLAGHPSHRRLATPLIRRRWCTGR
jgi:release factor glutamine methyltransferase